MNFMRKNKCSLIDLFLKQKKSKRNQFFILIEYFSIINIFFRFYFMLSLGKKIDSFKKKCFLIETGPYWAILSLMDREVCAGNAHRSREPITTQ